MIKKIERQRDKLRREKDIGEWKRMKGLGMYMKRKNE